MRAVTIELDRPRRLRFDVNALADAEERLGMGLGKIMQQEVVEGQIAVLFDGLPEKKRTQKPPFVHHMPEQHLETRIK